MNSWSSRTWMEKPEVFLDQQKAIDLDTASKLDAEATLLGRKVL